ncbi:MAG: hypothetical protein WB676_08815 [Bryobacteraceae bacterium]
MPPATTMLNHGVMEGKGAYNRHARIQAGGIALALPLLEKAVKSIELDRGDQPFVLADYGSSQGKNSLAPMRVAIENLRQRLGRNRPIFVFHIDQPSNDFNTLFEVLDADPDRYTLNDPNVFPCAIGRSFYKNVLPRQSVHLGWSSYAAGWLSRIPTRVPGHFLPLRSTGPERAAFQRQAAQDWEAFLSLRAGELRLGGRLVIVLPAFNDDGLSGLEDLMNHANDVLAEMVDEGTIRAEERERMALGTFLRRRSDLLAPFQSNGHFQGLTVEGCELISLPDPAWADYQRDGNQEALATKRALFFRSTFVTSLALGLADCQNAERCQVFADDFENLLKRHLAKHTSPLHSFVQIFIVSTTACL